MPAIDPGKLLSTLSVLLGPHGGIKSQDEVGHNNGSFSHSKGIRKVKKYFKNQTKKEYNIVILKRTKHVI